MDQDIYRTRPVVSQHEPRAQERDGGIILQAVRKVMAESALREMTACTMLVTASVESRSSVSETAARVLAGD